MKKILLILIPLGLIIFYLTQMTGSNDDYINEIEMYWKEKHEFFANAEASPFVQKGIEYNNVEVFPPDPAFKLNAKLERFTSRQVLKLANSDGTSQSYLKFAKAKFQLKGKEQSLIILKTLGFGNQYLTAFVDETSGDATYGGGRYLDVVIGKSDQVTIDFNKAYNPYCAYFDDFSCPLPPRENFISVKIEAGEKAYK